MMLERPMHARKGQRFPGYILPGEQLGLKAFGARREIRRNECRAEYQLHLRNARHGINREQPIDFDFGQRLFPRLPRGALRRRFALFHVARRNRPKAVARLDRAAAKKNSSVPRAYRSHHDLGVYVVDVSAYCANVSLHGVAAGHAAHKLATCLRCRRRCGSFAHAATLSKDTAFVQPCV